MMRRTTVVLLCALGGSPALPAGNLSPTELRDANRGNLNNLVVEMAKTDVLKLMGTQVVKAGPSFEGVKLINNPFRTETLLSGDGSKTLEVLFFYTYEDQESDITITNGDLTPLVVEEGKLKGWGWIFVKQIAKLYDIDIRIDGLGGGD